MSESKTEREHKAKGQRLGRVSEGLAKLGENPGVLIKNPVFYLVIILLVGVGFRVYKAHYTGIIYDEIWTYEDYCTDLHTAWTYYPNVNNHMLNSISIVLTEKVLGSYEHYIRVPAIFFGALFCGAITFIVHKTIRSPIMKIIVLLLVILNWFIFDLSYLARGYAMGLGAMYIAIAVLIHILAKTREGAQVSWWVVLLLVTMNFLALGAMLSSISLVLSVNIAYGLLMIFGSMKGGKKALRNAMVRVMAIIAGSAVSLYLLYQHVLTNIRGQSKNFEVEPFFEYLKKVLWESLIYFDISRIAFNKQVYNASLVLLGVCAVICLGVFFFRWKARKGRYLSVVSPAILILFLSGAVLGIMFILCVVLGLSLGWPRNGVFLLPLVLISSGILMDRGARALARIKILSFFLRFACVGLLGLLCFLNLPSPRAVNVRPYDWGEQSAIGPLVRILRQIDPEKTWQIKLAKPHMESSYRSIRYYQKFGYKMKWVWTGTYDVGVYPEHSPDSRAVYLENERFADHHCCIIVNTASFRNKRVIYQMHY